MLIPQGAAHRTYRRAIMWSITIVIAADAVSGPAGRWRRRRAAESWQTATGTVETVSVEPSPNSFPGRRALRISYSYQAGGEWHSGFDERQRKEADAWDEAGRLRGSSVLVRYNPQRPGTSLVFTRCESVTNSRVIA